jgi:isopentenyl diphosphate isomerase/L-lactate dehydrogenase-like FMN-dependent dehydrogenase
MSGLKNFKAWREGARRRLPKIAFDFVDGGTDDEVTMRRNEAAFEDLALIPKVLRGVESASTELELFGRQVAFPVLVAPTGDSRLVGPAADIAQARGAHAAGTFSILSGVASTPLDEVAAAVPQPGWYQVFLFRDREVTQRSVERAKQLGFSGLVLTVDGAVKGNRERDIRNGMQLPLRPTTKTIAGALRRPRWMWDYFTREPRGVSVESGFGRPARAFMAHRRQQPLSIAGVFNVDQRWEDLHWLRGIWDGPLLLKGVMCGEDAELALDAGCDGVIVSSHGGRELDAMPASIEMLPEVVAAVGGRAEILFDSGIRRGTDVIKALSIGAKACLVGRPWLYALAVGGEDGVREMLEQFHGEILRGMQLIGVTRLDQLGPEHVRRRPGSGWEPVAPLPHMQTTSVAHPLR